MYVKLRKGWKGRKKKKKKIKENGRREGSDRNGGSGLVTGDAN